jgi:septal ring factor EnvC (AmiA/AmiB activator)
MAEQADSGRGTKLVLALKNGWGSLIASVLAIAWSLIAAVAGWGYLNEKKAEDANLQIIAERTRRTDERLALFSEAIAGLRADAKDVGAEIVALRVDLGKLSTRMDSAERRLNDLRK